jgi:putative effector of murein hydrolase
MTRILSGVGWSLLGNAVLFFGAAIYNQRHVVDSFYDKLDNQVSNGAEAVTVLMFTVAAALLITGTVLVRTAATTSTTSPSSVPEPRG